MADQIDPDWAQILVGGGLAAPRKRGTLWLSPATGSPGDGVSRRCLHDRRGDADPSVHCRLRAEADAPALTARVLATGQVARGLVGHFSAAVLAERARQPTAWPPGPACGASWRSTGFAQRQMMSLGGPIPGRRRVGRCPRRCDIWLSPWECRRLSAPAVRSHPWAVPWRSLSRVPRQRGGWAGTAAAWSARARWGGGGTPLAIRPGRHARRPWTPSPRRTAHAQSLAPRRSRRRPGAWALRE